MAAAAFKVTDAEFRKIKSKALVKVQHSAFVIGLHCTILPPPGVVVFLLQ
jgi:hypothetical protein